MDGGGIRPLPRPGHHESSRFIHIIGAGFAQSIDQIGETVADFAPILTFGIGFGFPDSSELFVGWFPQDFEIIVEEIKVVLVESGFVVHDLLLHWFYLPLTPFQSTNLFPISLNSIAQQSVTIELLWETGKHSR